MTSDLAKLLPDIQVEDLTVRPWSLSQAIRLGVPLAELLDAANAAGLKLSAFFDGKAAASATADADKIAGFVLRNLAIVAEVLAVSVKMEAAQIGEWDLAKTLKVGKAVWEANETHLKKSFAPASRDTGAAAT